MINPNLSKNKSYYMNFKHKIRLYTFITYLSSFKFMYDLLFYKFRLNILMWEISPRF